MRVRPAVITHDVDSLPRVQISNIALSEVFCGLQIYFCIQALWPGSLSRKVVFLECCGVSGILCMFICLVIGIVAVHVCLLDKLCVSTVVYFGDVEGSAAHEREHRITCSANQVFPANFAFCSCRNDDRCSLIAKKNIPNEPS